MNETALVRQFEGRDVNIIVKEGGPYFKGRDLTDRLGYYDGYAAIRKPVETGDLLFVKNERI
jgi:prophage antirepressor-like protein